MTSPVIATKKRLQRAPTIELKATEDYIARATAAQLDLNKRRKTSGKYSVEFDKLLDIEIKLENIQCILSKTSEYIKNKELNITSSEKNEIIKLLGELYNETLLMENKIINVNASHLLLNKRIKTTKAKTTRRRKTGRKKKCATK